jgi:HK97 family phage portal protein
VNLLGLDIRRQPALTMLKLEAPLVRAVPDNLQTVPAWRFGLWPSSDGLIHESFPGAWQRNITIPDPQTSILAFSAVFACVTGIAADIGKMRIKLDKNSEGIWEEITENNAWLPVLRKPNHFQTRIKFLEYWIVTKLLWGNAYILKQRQDRRGIVTALYVLDPQRVTPLVAENGDVYYRINEDDLSRTDQLETVSDDDFVVPASEIIHDPMVCLHHPLVGVSPLYACAMSATMGNKIQSNSTNLFGNFSRPGGVVMFPTEIGDEQAGKFKARWEANFGGPNMGRTAILDNGAKFEAIAMPAEQAQLIEQLKWTVEDVARAFHYPAWKLGGQMPAYTKPELAMTSYYSDCLQALIESVELSLDEGLGLPSDQGTEMDLDNLMRMDTDALFESNNKMVSGGWGAPNEARFRANKKPVPGGESPMIQQQNYSLAALAKRDAQEDPFGTAKPEPKPEPPALPPAPEKQFTSKEAVQLIGLKLRHKLCSN